MHSAVCSRNPPGIWPFPQESSNDAVLSMDGGSAREAIMMVQASLDNDEPTPDYLKGPENALLKKSGGHLRGCGG